MISFRGRHKNLKPQGCIFKWLNANLCWREMWQGEGKGLNEIKSALAWEFLVCALLDNADALQHISRCVKYIWNTWVATYCHCPHSIQKCGRQGQHKRCLIYRSVIVPLLVHLPWYKGCYEPALWKRGWEVYSVFPENPVSGSHMYSK